MTFEINSASIYQDIVNLKNKTKSLVLFNKGIKISLNKQENMIGPKIPLKYINMYVIGVNKISN